MRKFLSLMMALMAVFSLSAKTIFLNTGGADLWKQGNAVFFIHSWGGEEAADVQMTQVGETDVFQAAIPDDNASVVFVRMPEGSEAINWDNKWNQTPDLTIPDGQDLYTITGWNNNDGAWSVYAPEAPVEEEAAMDTIYMWYGKRTTVSATEAVEMGGTAVAEGGNSNIVVGAAQKTNWTMKFNKGFSNANFIGITLNEALAEGDVMQIAAFRTSTTEAILGLDFSASKETASKDCQILFPNSLQVITSNAAPEDTTFTIPATAAGAKYIRLYRNSGSTGIYVANVTILREHSEEPGEQPGEEPIEEPVEHIYTVAGGSIAAFGASWDATAVANDMTLQEDGSYQFVKDSVVLDAGSVYFKVVEDHAWDIAYPAENYQLQIAEAGLYEITITFNAETKAITAAAVKLEIVDPVVVEHAYGVAGSSLEVFGVAWDPTAVANDMALQEDGFYLFIKDSVALEAGAIFFKVVADHTWDISYPADNYELQIAEAGLHTIAITFNAETKEVVGTAQKLESEEPIVIEPVDSITLYFVNVPAWEAVNAYAWQEGVGQNAEWPGVAMTPVNTQINEKDVYAYTFPASMEHIIFNNGNGAQTTDEVALWNAAKPYFYDGAWYESDSIPGTGEQPEQPELMDVVFTVTVPAGTDSVFIVGSINEWVFEKMSAVENAENQFTITKQLASTEGLEYKYTAGPEWKYVEKDAEGNEIGNRSYNAMDVVASWAEVPQAEQPEQPEEPVDSITLYFVNVPAWEAVNAYAWQEGVGQNAEWPGVAMTPVNTQINEKDVYAYSFPASMDHIIFNNGNGAQTADAVALWNASTPYFYDNAWYESDSIPGTGEQPEQPELMDVVFTVTVPAGTDSVFIVGSINEWVFEKMSAVENAENQFTITKQLASTEGLEYKYTAGPKWKYVEKDAEGNEIGNRSYNAMDVVASWAAVPQAEQPEQPVEHIYTVAGDAALLAESWNPAAEANDMMLDAEDGLYKLVVEDMTLDARGYEYKVTVDHSWNVNYPTANAVLNIAERAIYTVTFTFNAETKDVNALAVKTADAPEQPVVEMKALQLIPGTWAENVLAIWAWSTPADADWYMVSGEGDTLSAMIPETADSVIVVAFPAEVEINWNNKLAKTANLAYTACVLFMNDGNPTWCEASQPEQPEEPTLENGFYLVGTFNNWTPAAEYHLVGNVENPGEFMVTATLAEADSLKVVNVVSDTITAWYPGEAGNYVVDAAHAGEKTIYFRPEGGQEGWHAGVIYVAENDEPIVDNGPIKDTYFADVNWTQEFESNATWNAETNKITVNIAADKNAQWQGQVKLYTITAEEGKCYNVTYKLKANNAITGVTFKWQDNNSDPSLIFEDKTIALEAGVEYAYTKVVAGIPGNGIAVFDFGFAHAGDTIELYDFVIAETECPEPIYTVAGDAALLAESWNPAAEANDMTLDAEDGLYKLVVENLTLDARDYEYKVTVDHSWNVNYPTANAVLNIAERAIYTVTFTFNAETKDVNALAVKTADAPAPEEPELIDVVFTVNVPAGTDSVFIAGSFNDWAEFVMMSAAEGVENQFTLTIQMESVEGLEYKYLAAPNWDYVEKNAEGENIDNRTYNELDVVAAWANPQPEQPEEPTLVNGFYLVGTFNDWTPAAEYHFVGNPENTAEFMLTVNLEVDDQLKVVNVVDNVITAWYPGEGENYTVDAAHAGEKTIYFRPDYQEAWAEFGGYFYIQQNEATVIDSIDANGQAVKVLRNNQLFIIKGDAMFNLMGIRIQ